MNQSSVILGAVLFGYFVYVTVRGQLPTFIGIVTGAAAPAPATASSTSTAPAVAQTPTAQAQGAALGGT